MLLTSQLFVFTKKPFIDLKSMNGFFIFYHPFSVVTAKSCSIEKPLTQPVELYFPTFLHFFLDKQIFMCIINGVKWSEVVGNGGKRLCLWVNIAILWIKREG